MEAKDTVMGKSSIEEVKYLETRDNPEYRDLRLLEKRNVEDRVLVSLQAEITWPIAFTAGKEAGMREVVKFAEKCKRATECHQEDGALAWEKGDIGIDKTLWQAFLKEKGIE